MKENGLKFVHSTPLQNRLINGWLILLGVLVYAMILIGGATRLTDSGLSITEWEPFAGALPPLSAEAWLKAFELYQTTSEFKFQNFEMSLEEFKYIYWWEWAHRFFGRIIGLVAVFGLIWFWMKGWLSKNQKIHYSLLIALGGLQGFIGWWMVASGVGESTRIDVAPYRLAVHFTLALVIISYITFLLTHLNLRTLEHTSNKDFVWAVILLILVFVQMASGALVAGLDAGRTYTDWPLINGELIPRNYIEPSLGIRSLFEGVLTAQFNHRIIAYFLLITSVIAAIILRMNASGRNFAILATMILLQSSWGILTLVHAAPLGLALIHQGFGVLILVYASNLTAICFGNVGQFIARQG